jgi:N-acyl homoserine lactone hydrolase
MASATELNGIHEHTGATMVFGHDAEQIHQLRVAPKEFYS